MSELRDSTAAQPTPPRPGVFSPVMNSWMRPAVPVIVLGFAVALPFIVTSAFTLGIFTDSLVYVALALSYALCVGRVGALSLAHPAFFGTGAYAAAIVVERYSLSFGLQLLIAVATAIALAFLIGIPAFRLSNLTFGMATLGFALIAELVAQNAVNLTNGPLCIAGLSPLSASALGALGIDQNGQQYYILLAIAVGVAAFFWVLVRSRIGRAYIAVREDEPMAMSVGIGPKRYRMSAFVIGAAIAGFVGAFYAHYLSVVCPTNLDISYTINLLVILFLGGVGGFWGIIAAAFIFTAVPEWLQITPSLRLIIYGATLLLCVTFLPGGLEGAAKTLRLRITRRHRAGRA